MSYSIYKNVRNEDFDVLKRELDFIERISTPFMQRNDFYLNKDHSEDVLGIDYFCKSSKYLGNIGMKYNEEKSTQQVRLFEFYILKAYDTEEKRFYKKEHLNEVYTLEQIKEQSYDLFGKCISIYNSLTDKDLVNNVTLRKLK
jgi:hypothetical protein